MRLVITGSRRGHPDVGYWLRSWHKRRGAPDLCIVGDGVPGQDKGASSRFQPKGQAMNIRIQHHKGYANLWFVLDADGETNCALTPKQVAELASALSDAHVALSLDEPYLRIIEGD